MSHQDNKKDLEERLAIILIDWINQKYNVDYKIGQRQPENSHVDIELTCDKLLPLHLQLKEYQPDSTGYQSIEFNKTFEIEGVEQHLKGKLVIATIPQEINFTAEIIERVKNVNGNNSYSGLVLLIAIFAPECDKKLIDLSQIFPYTTNLKGCYLLKPETVSGVKESYVLEVKSALQKI